MSEKASSSSQTMELVVVSNRLPFQLRKEASEWGQRSEWRRSKAAGGLVTAIKPLLVSSKGVWVGWPGVAMASPSEELAIPEDPEDTIRSEQIVGVALTQQETDDFYSGMCNATLWPLLHSMLDKMSLDNKGWRTYQEVNERFANRLLGVVLQHRQRHRRVFVWIHDYHLMLMAKMARDKYFSMTNKAFDEEHNLMAFFLHVPFPTFGVLQHLEGHEHILEGMLGNDIIGFQDENSARNFVLCCREALGLTLFGLDNKEKNSKDNLEVIVKTKEGRRVTVRALPIGIPFERFQRMVELVSEHTISPDSVEAVVRRRRTGNNFQLMVGVDRLDYTKGIPNRLRAFDLLLDEHPQLRDRLTLLQVAVPSRTNVKAYQEERDLIRHLVTRITDKHGPRTKHGNHVPIVYVEQPLSQRTLAALYNVADVAVVTSLKDGMNLVAMEYVACQQFEDPEMVGALILSKETGAARHLSEAVLVDPEDVANISEGMLAALAMSNEERAERMKRLKQMVRQMDVGAWMEQFVRLVDTKAELMHIEQLKMENHEDKIAKFLDNRAEVLFLLDFDGTLCPIEMTPEQAHLSDRMRNTLDRLIRLGPRVRLAAISGRSIDDIEAKITNRPRQANTQRSVSVTTTNDAMNNEGVGQVLNEDESERWIGGHWIISGNHGDIIRYPDGRLYEPSLDEQSVTKLAEMIEETVGTKFIGTRIERKRFSVCVHVRQVAGGEVAKEEALRETEAIAKEFGFVTQRGHASVECKAPGSGSKGTAALHILSTCFGDNWRERKDVAVLCFGDDTTDEDAMSVVKSADNGLAFRVVANEDEKTSTVADIRLDAMLDVQVILEFICSLLQQQQQQQQHDDRGELGQ